MNLFRRSAATTTSLTPAARFIGIGAASAAKKAGDDTMTEEERAAKKKADDDADAKKKADDEEAARVAAETEAAAAGTTAAKSDKDDEDEDDEEDEDGDDDSDERDMKRGSKSKACRARRRERARISHILGHASAAANVEFAAHVALNTDMTRSQATALLEKAPKGAAAGSLATRMVGAQPAAPRPGASQQQPADKGKAIIADVFGKIAEENKPRG